MPQASNFLLSPIKSMVVRGNQWYPRINRDAPLKFLDYQPPIIWVIMHFKICTQAVHLPFTSIHLLCSFHTPCMHLPCSVLCAPYVYLHVPSMHLCVPFVHLCTPLCTYPFAYPWAPSAHPKRNLIDQWSPPQPMTLPWCNSLIYIKSMVFFVPTTSYKKSTYM